MAAYTGLLAVIAGIILLLGLVIPYWLSALIVGLVIIGIGAFLALKGINTLRNESPAPRETVETLKEDGQWLRNQTR